VYIPFLQTLTRETDGASRGRFVGAQPSGPVWKTPIGCRRRGHESRFSGESNDLPRR